MTSRKVEVRWGCAEMMMYGYLEITCQGGVMVMGHGSYLEVGTIHTYLPSMTCEGFFLQLAHTSRGSQRLREFLEF